MGLYGEVIQSTLSPSKRILIDLPLKPPTDEVRYAPSCGGCAYSKNRYIIWKSRGNELELIDHAPDAARELGQSVIVQFPRHVQVAPFVSIKQSGNGSRLQLLIISQASFHLVELLELTGAPSILSDLTSSSFKRTMFQFPVPLSIKQCSAMISSSNQAVVAIAAKNQKSTVYTLSLGDTVPVITELSTSSMLGRFLWSSGSASSQPRALRCIESEKAYIVALCQDEMIRVWTHDGQLKLESEFAQADQRNNSDESEPIFGLELVDSDEQTDIYIQIGNVIYRGAIELGDSIKMDFIGSVSVVNQNLISFCVVNDTIWAACQETDGGEIVVKSASMPQSGVGQPLFLDCAPPRPPPELLPPYASASSFLLQADLILPYALRQALEQVVSDLPEALNAQTINQIIQVESNASEMSPEAYASELYQIVLQYHYESVKFNGFSMGNTHSPPLIVRSKCCSMLRPLTALESVCSGLSLEQTNLTLPVGAGRLLSNSIVTLNRILYESEVLEAFEDQINTGKSPLSVALELVDEIDRLVSDSTEADKLMITFDDDSFEHLISAIITHLETSPITRHTTDASGKVEHVGTGEIDAQRWTGQVVRSIIANMSKLSQLLLILSVWVKPEGKMTDIKERLARVVSDYLLMEWVCNTRGVRKITKSEDFMSSISSTIMSQSQSTLIGDSFVSLSQTGMAPILTTTEEPLLELWLAQVGREQAQSLCPLGDANNQGALIQAIQQLISPQNRLLTIPVYLLETNQIELLAQWVELNSYSDLHDSIKSSLAYLNGVCHLHQGEIETAAAAFQDATANLNEDFFLTHVLRDVSSENDLKLKTSFYLCVISMFKGHPEQQVKLAHDAVHEADPNDERLSMLWTMVFKLNLELENYPDAYTAMTSNTDDDRRKDCLRNFVLHLSERGDLAPLVEAPYGGLEAEIGSILENRALAVSAHDTRYFDLLFAFHITKENFRQAARAMYLHATQLKNENDGLKSIMLREAALLATINCLNLAEPSNQWISIGENNMCALSPKRGNDGDFRLGAATTTSVIGLDQIENELRLVQARFILAESGVETFALSPSEVATLLCQADLYDEAADLLLAFDLSLEAPIVQLAKKYACAIGRPDAQEIESQLTEMIESREKRATSTTLYRAACEEILKFGHMIPSDLLEQFKQRDMNDVLRLLTKYGEIDCAVDVAIELLGKARLNHKEINNENISLLIEVPVLLIEQLNYFLKTSKHEQHAPLEEAMSSYLDYLEKTATIAPSLTVGYAR